MVKNTASHQHLIMVLDQGTTSSRAIVFNQHAEIVALAQEEFAQHYPDNGRVEHDPEDIWASTLRVAQQALKEAEKKRCARRRHRHHQSA
jgi:glycerol kinase